jgi:hypothetical protein
MSAWKWGAQTHTTSDDVQTYRDGANNIERVASKVYLQVERLPAGSELIKPLEQQVDTAVHVRLVRLDRAHRVHVGDFPPHHTVHRAVSRAEQVVVRDAWVSPGVVPFGLGKRRRHAVDGSHRGWVVDAVHLGGDADDFLSWVRRISNTNVDGSLCSWGESYRLRSARLCHITRIALPDLEEIPDFAPSR